MRTAILLALLSTTAHANNHEITIVESARALRTSSANALTEDGLLAAGMTYARRLPVELGPLVLWGHAGFDVGAADGTMFQTLTTELTTFAGHVGARARYDLWRQRVIANARLDVGMVRAAVELADESGRRMRDAGWGATTTVAGGVDLVALRGRRVSLGVRVELGVVATSSIPLTATPVREDDDTLQLEMTAASLGALNLTGPVFAGSLVGQF